VRRREQERIDAVTSPASRPSSSRRLIAAAALAVAVAAGLVVHGLLPDTAATDIAGDMLYAVALYLALAVVMPRATSILLGAIALVWCSGVELFQLTGIPVRLAADFPPVALVLGTGFDPRDLFAYAVAVVAVTAIDIGVRRARRATA
jgi:hypothetical protein